MGKSVRLGDMSDSVINHVNNNKNDNNKNKNVNNNNKNDNNNNKNNDNKKQILELTKAVVSIR